jgi:hypothetical protein
MYYNTKHFQIPTRNLFRISFSFFVFLSVIFLSSVTVKISAQSNLWMVGNKYLDFSNSSAITTENLPQPSVPASSQQRAYAGQLPKLCQFAEYDESGDLLFFIVDGKIYDSEGYLMVANGVTGFTPYPHYPSLILDIQVVKIPGDCSKYFILFGHHPEVSSIFSVAVLDLNLPNQFWPTTRLGGLVDLSPYEDYIYDEDEAGAASIYPINFYDWLSHLPFDDTAPLYATINGHSVTFSGSIWGGSGAPSTPSLRADMVIYDNAPNGEKKLIVAKGTQGWLWDVTSNGVYITDETNCLGYTNGWPRLNERMTVSQYDGYYYVFTGNELDETYQLGKYDASWNSVQCYPTGFPTDPLPQYLVNQIATSERSMNGRYIYYVSQTAPYFNYIDLADLSSGLHNLTSISALSGIAAYNDCMMALNNYQGVASIYLFHSTGISVLKGVDNPASVTLITNPFPGLLPPQVNLTGFASAGSFTAYTTYPDPVVLQSRNYQIQQMTELQSGSCCLANINADTPLGYTVNAGAATWSYGAGNNPWNATGPIHLNGDLIFNYGANITINGMEFRFSPTANAVIKKGSRVSLTNNTKWTSYECTGLMWPGADLFGTTNATNSVDQSPLSGNPDQGYLYMNNAIIENAVLGVDVGTTAANSGGGIIKAYNSTFRNNQYDVYFRKYHFVNASGNYIQNKSLFNNCTFITDAPLKQLELIPASHAMLYDVDKINFTNCSFMNTTALSTYNWTSRGTGIFSSKSSFVVDGLNDTWNGLSTDPDQTTFYKLRYGIRSFGSNNPLAFYTCKQQEFQQCLYGITNYNTDNVQIYLNNFQLPETAGNNTNGSMERGIYLTNSTGYTVEQNFFDGYNDPSISEAYPCALGIWVDNSGDAANQIRNNDFDEMKLGTYVTKNNRFYVFGVDEPGEADDDGSIDQTGLQLFCNTYTNGQTDIFRDSETLMRQDQGGNQLNGSNLKAGNRFSAPNCSGAISDFVVDPDNNFYTYYHCHDQANTIPDCGGISNHPLTPNMNLLPVDVISGVPYADSDCSNTYGGPIIIGPNPGVISGIIGQLQTVREELIDAKDTYLQVVDGSQKQSTLDILSEAFPHESGFYRNLLMQRYPLSDEVLKRLIIEASRLSSWHLTEVFLANSPLSKEILYKIEEANILTSFFMSFLYDADSGASLRRLMELNMLSLATERDQLIQSIARAGLTYETNAESETDQPIYLNDYLSQFTLQDGSTALRIRAANLAASGDYPSAIALLTNEPLLASYSNILQMEQSVNGDWSLLNASQINALWDIHNSKKDYSSSIALSILQQIGVADFEPEPRVPIQHRSLLIAKDESQEEMPLLGVWPNPASSSAWLHYPIEADEKATIQIFDPQGRLVQSFQPNTKGLVELSLKNYESGIYVVQLIAFDKVVENIKLTVIHKN